MSYDMARDAQSTTSAHKVIGILNVLFSSVMLLCGTCGGISAVTQIATAPMQKQMQEQQFKALAAEQRQKREEEIEDLKSQEAAAATPAEKAAFEARRKVLEQQPDFDDQAFKDFFGIYQNSKFIGYLIADFSTGLLLNVLLFAAGIGLIMSRSWARRLSVIVAALKIVRLVLVYGFFAIFVLPAFSQQMGKAMDQMAGQARQNQPAGPQIPKMGTTIATVYGVMGSTYAVVMMIFGSIYPIIILIVLTRPAVKAACGEAVSVPLVEPS